MKMTTGARLFSAVCFAVVDKELASLLPFAFSGGVFG
jgi:hypothetical protein